MRRQYERVVARVDGKVAGVCAIRVNRTGRGNHIANQVRDGVLVQPFAATIEEGIGYYLVYPPERATQPKIRLLREWMLETAQGTRT